VRRACDRLIAAGSAFSRVQLAFSMLNDAIERPALLTHTAAVLCVFNVLGFLLYDPSAGGLATFVVLYGLLASVSFAVIWYFWRGQNWARWLVLGMSALSLLNMASLPSVTRAGTVLMVAEAAFGIWLLYWLNTKVVALYFRSTPRRPALGKAAIVILGTVAVAVVLLLVAMGASMLFSPTPRPVYDDEISSAHREAFRGLYPDGESLQGLFSMGVFDVTEEGCLFTNRRILVFEGGKVIQQATFEDIRDLRLHRERQFVGMSELAVERHDGIQLYCRLPNAGAYPNDASEFHERLTRIWRR
jgi:hypothetical protein